MILPRSFYKRNTVTVAKELLGKTLTRKIGKKIISGIITETEAYRHSDDPASHAYRGRTPRNQIMFEEVGKAYVYFTYGMHYCVNAVAKSKNYEAGAVLIRSLKPITGINEMIKFRKINKLEELVNGPAKLTQALCITKNQYGLDLTTNSGLFISDGIRVKKIQAGPRIGIKNALDKKWNFKIKN